MKASPLALAFFVIAAPILAPAQTTGAKAAVSRYLDAWKRKDYRGMVKASQLTWVKSESDPAEMLKDWYDFRVLNSYSLVSAERSASAMCVVTVVVHYTNFGREKKTKRIPFNVICETGPYKPSPSGKWGVNPTSGLNEQ